MKALETLKIYINDEFGMNSVPQYVRNAIAELEALQSRSCDGCKYFNTGAYEICPITEPLMRQWLSYDKSTFCCNRYEPKEQ